MSSIPPEFSCDNFTRQELAEIVRQILELIRKLRLIEKRFPGEKYTQGKVSEIIQLSRSEDLSAAKKDRSPISVEKRCHIIQLLLSYFQEIEVTADGRPVIKNRMEDLVTELAGKLTLNLIDVSTKFDNDSIPYNEMLVKEETYAERLAGKSAKRERFIAVVGAGASKAATIKSSEYIPDAQEAAARLRAAFTGRVDQSIIAEKTKQVAERMRTSPDNFEAQMLAMAQFSAKMVTDELTNLCGNKNVPCLVYEILAHMFKHRFVDVIVNFNYDELLDNAISEELPNPGDYRYVYTAGHCPNNLKELRIDNRIKQPIYIKCQGTISQSNSMRFMEAKAFMMERAIQDHLLELLEGHVPDAISQEFLPINLLVFGFSMQNHVFNNLIKRSLETNPEKLTLWLFDIDANILDYVRAEFAAEIRDKKLEVKFLPLSNEFSLEQVLIDIWEETSSNFDPYYQPRGIDRHLFIDHFFHHVSPIKLYQREKRKSSFTEKYYRDRLFVELFILILQSNGIIHLSQLTRSRTGKFLLKLKNETNGKHAIFDYLDKMGMEPYQDFMFDTFVLRDRDSLKTKKGLIQFLTERLSESVKMKESRKAITDQETLEPLIKGVLKRRLLLVNPKYDHVHDNIFAELPPKNIMNTSLAWIYNYRQNIVSKLDDWDVMLTITEEGGFLRQDFRNNRFVGKNKFFEVILAANGTHERDNSASKWLNQGMLLSGELKYRPWWLHNKHMIILLKRKATAFADNWRHNWKLVEGFFYHHKMLSRRVNPVKIEGEKDLTTLLYMFAIYWRGTLDSPVLSNYEKLDLSVVTNLEDVDAALNEILAPYETKRPKNSNS